MNITPQELFRLAIERHREPWNWTLQFAAAVVFCLALLFHSSLLVTAALILFGVGFMKLHMDEPPDNRWFRFVARSVEWEKNWESTPWTWIKITKCMFVLAATGLLLWALWVREPATLGLFFGFVVLYKVMLENIDSGIEP